MPNTKHDFNINFCHGDSEKYVAETPTDYGGKRSNSAIFLYWQATVNLACYHTKLMRLTILINSNMYNYHGINLSFAL
jgi:hypothetical protein